VQIKETEIGYHITPYFPDIAPSDCTITLIIANDEFE